MARMEGSQDKPRIVLIAGPTASGKSSLALRLAQATDGELINADALQLYADLRLLTARPSAREEALAPHHLFGVADAADGWSVGRWLRAANDVLADIEARGRTAIVVGGTGLYFRALTQGLAPTPQVSLAARETASGEFDRLGEAAFRARLVEVDPDATRRIAAGDRQRLVRAWSVFAATGRSLSAWQADAEGALPPGSWCAVALTPPRQALYARCDARLEAMLRGGALAEAEALVARRLDPGLPLMKAVGVREFTAHLAGRSTLAEALAAAQRETRRYAKRQMTWLRGQQPDWPRIDAPEPQAQWAQFLALHPALTG
jgi:tRNA dimethylallyltransferase